MWVDECPYLIQTPTEHWGLDEHGGDHRMLKFPSNVLAVCFAEMVRGVGTNPTAWHDLPNGYWVEGTDEIVWGCADSHFGGSRMIGYKNGGEKGHHLLDERKRIVDEILEQQREDL